MDTQAAPNSAPTPAPVPQQPAPTPAPATATHRTGSRPVPPSRSRYGWWAVIVLLLALVGGCTWYILRQREDIELLTQGFELEKEMLQDEYSDLSIQYEGFRYSVNNDSLVALLITEQEKVQRLQEELRTVKATNSRRMAEMKKELETLRAIMRGYVIRIDSLNRENEQLKEDNRIVHARLGAAGARAERLERERQRLAEKVSLAERLEVGNIFVQPLTRRGRPAKYIRNTAHILITFTLGQNISAQVGERTLYLRLLRPDDEVMVKSRANNFYFEGREVPYSIKRIVAYEGNEVEVEMHWTVEEYLSPGAYRADIYGDGLYLGSVLFHLKD
ncbi:MAG: hypothetical protein LBB27_04365 [Tannerellaceae bacterium]|nr:hypothetical protein [Tannerellaceae bacterium]